MGRPRNQLDKMGQAQEVLDRLQNEPPGWKRERLLALKHGLSGEMSLKEIGEAVGRARSCIQRWFDLFRNHGLERVLHKEHAGGIESTLSASAAEGMTEKLREGAGPRTPKTGSGRNTEWMWPGARFTNIWENAGRG